MTEKLNIINEQLDELLIKQLQLIQDYISVTTECESQQKTGFINLAKARYIQGFHSVSKNCLFSEDSEEERPALVKVAREKSSIELETKDANDPVIAYEKPTLVINSDKSLETQLNKQFGFLSSTTLKYARTDFRKCVEKTVERAEILQQYLAVQMRYKSLMKERSEIQESIHSP